MRRQNRVLMTWVAALVASQGLACSIQLESILEVEDGSVLEIVAFSLPPENLDLEGGTVMNIDVSISLLELLFLGTIDGDVAVGDLLFAAPPFNFLGIPALNTGEICIVIDETAAPSEGTFEADLVDETATFDVAINTIALLGNPVLAANLPGGGFQFPFDLQSTQPLSFADMLALLGGSSSIEISQQVDEEFVVDFGGQMVPISVTGQIHIASTDAFPSTPLVQDCIAFLEQ